MVMERAGGQTIFAFQKNATKQELAEVHEETLKKVLKLHQNGIVHQDLHNKNIMYSQEHGVSLIDFGLAEKEGRGFSMTTNREMEELLKYIYKSPKSKLAKEVQVSLKEGSYKQFLKEYR
jgi:tRNA A-37 threonylcarbamoyl transferase component Bud32